MSAFIYGVVLQWKLDIRSKSLLITCYLVPLLFYFVMGGIFTSIVPGSRDTLIQSMTVLGVSMGALIGLPPSIVEIYGSEIKKIYKANAVPMYQGLVSMLLSSFIHLLTMSVIIYITAPIVYDAAVPASLISYFASLSVVIAVSLSLGSVLGLAVKSQAKLNTAAQLLFLPSMMLSGILFPVELLPRSFAAVGKIFPAAWGYKLTVCDGSTFSNLWPLAVILAAATAGCGFLLKRMKSD